MSDCGHEHNPCWTCTLENHNRKLNDENERLRQQLREADEQCHQQVRRAVEEREEALRQLNVCRENWERVENHMRHAIQEKRSLKAELGELTRSRDEAWRRCGELEGEKAEAKRLLRDCLEWKENPICPSLRREVVAFLGEEEA